MWSGISLRFFFFSKPGNVTSGYENYCLLRFKEQQKTCFHDSPNVVGVPTALMTQCIRGCYGSDHVTTCLTAGFWEACHSRLTTHANKKILQRFIFSFFIAKYNGSISAEHGLGFKKANYIHYSKSSSSVALMKEIKGLLDPKVNGF